MSIIAFVLAVIALFRPLVSRADIEILTKKIEELELKLKQLESGGQVQPAAQPEAEKPAHAPSEEPAQPPAPRP